VISTDWTIVLERKKEIRASESKREREGDREGGLPAFRVEPVQGGRTAAISPLAGGTLSWPSDIQSGI